MSVKTYSLKKDGEKSLSPHFKVKEFRCKDGSDKILIETGLIDTLEKVYEHFNCSKINISSGYRTAAHDKKVGGRGSGNHVEGKAADFTAYAKNGKPISSKEVCLYLEDIGILGIGYRAGGSETSTHVDVNYRKTKWYGDEKKSMSASIGSSFYKYLGVEKKPAEPKSHTYKVVADVLNVRSGAGTAYAIKTFSQFTAADQSQIKKLSKGKAVNGYVKGLTFMTSGIKDKWAKAPSGWVCLDFCEKVK